MLWGWRVTCIKDKHNVISIPLPDGGVTVKKICTLLIVATAFWTNSIDAQYTTTRVGDYSYTTGPRTNLTTTRIGNFLFRSGTLNGQRYNTTTTRIGNYGFTSGSYRSPRTGSLLSRVGSYLHTTIRFPGR